MLEPSLVPVIKWQKPDNKEWGPLLDFQETSRAVRFAAWKQVHVLVLWKEPKLQPV